MTRSKVLVYLVFPAILAVLVGVLLTRQHDISATHGSTTPSYAIDTVRADNTYTFVFTTQVDQNEINIGSVTPCSVVTSLGSAFVPHRFHVVGKTFSDATTVDWRINHDNRITISGVDSFPFSDGVNTVGFMNLPIDPSTFTRQPKSDSPNLNAFLDASTDTSFNSLIYSLDRTFARSPDHPHVHSTAEPYEASDEWVFLTEVKFFFEAGTPEGVYNIDLSNTPAPGAAYTSLNDETADTTDIVNAASSQLFDGRIALDLAGGATVDCQPPEVVDGEVKRIGGPHGLRMSSSVTKSVTVVVRNGGTETTDIGVYLAFLPPGGTSNPGDCSVSVAGETGAEPASQVFNWARIVTGNDFLNDVPAAGGGRRVSLKIPVTFTCNNTAGADGLNWSLKAISDGRDWDPGLGFPSDFDFGSCDTLSEVFSATCSTGLSDDDNDDADNTRQRDFPIVTFVP